MGMRGTVERRIWGLVAVVAVAALAVQVVAWRDLFVRRSNVLARNSGWAVMKEEVIYHPSAWEEFVRTPIDATGVDLWRGQGYQGIRWVAEDGVRVERLRLDAELRFPGSYLYVLFRIQDQGAYALRLSAHPQHPSGFFVFESDWRAVSFEPLAEDVLPPVGREMEIDLRLRGAEAAAFLDGEEIGRFRHDRFAAGTVGLKGGFLPVRIAGVEIEGTRAEGGPYRWHDDFRHGTTDGLAALAASVGLPLLVLVAVLFVLERRGHGGARTPSLLLLVLVGSTLSLAVQWWTPSGLPALAGILLLLLGVVLVIARAVRLPQRRRTWASLAAAGLLLLAGVALAALALRAGRGLPIRSGGERAAAPTVVPISAAAAGPRVGEPIALGGARHYGDQSLRLRARLAEGSLLEIRFWMPELAPLGDEYRCSGRWHGLLLSTVPQIASGFYLYDADVEPLGLLRDPEAVVAQRPLDVEVTVRGNRLAAYGDGALLAEARVPAGESGISGLYLFAGAAELESAGFTGRPRDFETRWLPDGGLWAAASLLVGAAVLVFARRGPLAALGAALLAAVPAVSLLAAGTVLARSFPVAEMEARLWACAALWAQGVALLAFLPLPAGRLRSWRLPIVVLLTVVVAGVAFFASWEDPYRVVQVEMQAPVPAVPYQWLWYRHPSFRACNGFVQNQQFAGYRASLAPAAESTRVVTLGASQTLGFGASDIERSFPRQLEHVLDASGAGPFEVVNAGIPGSYTVTGRSYFEGVLARYSPDVVVVNYCAADYIYLSLLSLAGFDPDGMLDRIEREGFQPSGLERLVNNVRFWYGLQRSQRGASPDHDWVRGTYERSLRALVRSAAARGARVFVLLEPKTSEIEHPGIDYPALYDAARRVAELEGAEVIDPSRSLQWAEQSGVVWWDYAHLTDFGYRVLADDVARAILRTAAPGGTR